MPSSTTAPNSPTLLLLTPSLSSPRSRVSKTTLLNKLLPEVVRADDRYHAFRMFDEVPEREGVGLDRFSWPALKAASKVKGLVERMEIHGLAIKLGFDKDPFVQTDVGWDGTESLDVLSRLVGVQ